MKVFVQSIVILILFSGGAAFAAGTNMDALRKEVSLIKEKFGKTVQPGEYKVNASDGRVYYVEVDKLRNIRIYKKEKINSFQEGEWVCDTPYAYVHGSSGEPYEMYELIDGEWKLRARRYYFKDDQGMVIGAMLSCDGPGAETGNSSYETGIQVLKLNIANRKILLANKSIVTFIKLHGLVEGTREYEDALNGISVRLQRQYVKLCEESKNRRVSDEYNYGP